MKTTYNEQIYCDINAQYLIALFDTFRREQPTYYILLMHAGCDLFAIQQTYDYRRKKRAIQTECVNTEPLRWFSAKDFIESADLFHERDEFRVSLMEDMCIIDNQFDADIILTLLRQNISLDCRRAVHSDQQHALLAELVAKYGFSPDEQERVGRIIDEINAEIMSDLQYQYNHLKALSFIEK